MLRQIKNLLFFTVITTVMIFSAGSVSAVSLSPSISKSLDTFESFNIESPDSLVQVIVFVEDDNSMPAPSKMASFNDLDFRAKHKIVIEDLQMRSSDLLESVSAHVLSINPDTQIKRFWIAPALAFEIPLSMIDELTKIPGVVSVIEDGAIEYIQPVESNMTASKVSGNYGHLTAMNIPAVWEMGIDGSDRLICNFDTGVDGEHPALQSKWRGNSASASASWLAPHQIGTTPQDIVGHGTQTMGIMVGATDSDTIGVAPGAQWMGAAVVDQGQTLSNTISDI
ncbi:MAG: S8 family serine peptidase, partial [candidate division Zixibacteria bacterium]|nr:S8 family serine peptidase [candidate division Zixibacteria bacterium]